MNVYNKERYVSVFVVYYPGLMKVSKFHTKDNILKTLLVINKMYLPVTLYWGTGAKVDRRL